MTTETAKQIGGADLPARFDHAVAGVSLGAGEQMVAETEMEKGAALAVVVEVEVKELDPVGHGLQISHNDGL